MEKDSMSDHVDNGVIDLLDSFGMLKSTVEIFAEAVDYDTSLDNKYNNMVKVIDLLILNMESDLGELCKQLDLLLKNADE